MHKWIVVCVLWFSPVSFAAVQVGVGRAEITPPLGTPSAGYRARHGEGMEGVNDPLWARALFIDTGDKRIVLCSVDHLGFSYEMTRAVTQRVQETVECEVYIASSHTHSGGGAYINIPVFEEWLSGPYNPEIVEFYIAQTHKAISAAYEARVPAKVGVGYGEAEALSHYRSTWPSEHIPLSQIMVLKVVDLNECPLALLFNYPCHPTVLPFTNRFFSADFVGYTCEALQEEIGVTALYINGAQGDIVPKEGGGFDACQRFAASLAPCVKQIWEETEVFENLKIETRKKSYSFVPQATPFGLVIPVEKYQSEINLLVFNKIHAFVTIPGELSSLYDERLKCKGQELGLKVSVFGLTNDAHGYIILPEAWRRRTFESRFSLGGENYGAFIEAEAQQLLEAFQR